MVNAHETLDDLLGFMAWGTEGSAAHGACNTNDMLGSHRSTNWQGSTGLQNRGLAVDNDNRLRPAAATMGHTARACDAHMNLDNLCKSMAWGAEVCNTHERHGFITFSWSTEASACAQKSKRSKRNTRHTAKQGRMAARKLEQRWPAGLGYG